MKILVINCGSSSAKYELFDIIRHRSLEGLQSVIVGTGSETLDIISTCTTYPLLPQVELMDVLRQTKIIIVPSLFDANPNIVTEAINNGCRVLVSKNVGSADCLPDKYVCDDANPGDLDEWVTKIKHMLG